MNAKVLLSALIVGLFAASAAVAGDKSAPAPVEPTWDKPVKVEPILEPCYKAELVHGQWDSWGKSANKHPNKSKTVEIDGKTYKLKGLELICIEPAAPAPATPACVPTKWNNYCDKP
ncbi:hypothetical protein [Crenothrix sp.]|uniref:hypothetical protein n=1 Tax=Crenothrix sp. TaxID=3100433 RepID=UPI00374D89A5